MDLASITCVCQTLFAALECRELRDIYSILDCESELDKLEKTVNTVKAVLLDAENKGVEELNNQAQLFIEELKDAVYDADDLLDEFVTIAERKHKVLLKKGSTEKVRRFFSRIKDLPFAYKMSQGVKEVRHRLNDIADNHNKFGFKVDSVPILKRREETCSYVYAHDIVGRDVDKENIVGMLLDHNVPQDVSFVSIVGMGGLGKTALAQLIYNDERITKYFPTRIWACVADEDPKHLNVKSVLGKILGSNSSVETDEPTLDLLQNQVQDLLRGNKYLLVLDDLWNENRHDWLKLEPFLKGGKTGSWVVATTRSRQTARMIGNESLYELEGLSDEDSWQLFERVALEENGGQANPQDLSRIGKIIVKKCANVPLAIRVVGSLLYGQDKEKWLSFERNRLADVNPKENGILPVLKYSYHHLEIPLKSCFSYCALFPKDFEIDRETLVSLWMAQGYIVPLTGGQSIEDAASEYISILLRRCFFQDVKKDKSDEIVSFKLHDLMHDVAQEVVQKEVCTVDYITSDLDKKIRHLSVAENTSAQGTWMKNKIRTLIYLQWGKKGLPLRMLLGNWISLRSLDLSYSDIDVLPNEICRLLHLRYLDVSCNYHMKFLPKSFTNLHNLQTLKLKRCWNLVELPNDFGRLANLRFLDIEGCFGITHMPPSMRNLCCLSKLPHFVVDLGNPTCYGLLDGLKALTKLKGSFEIKIHGSESARMQKGINSKRGYFLNKEYLEEIVFRLVGEGGGEDNQEAIMEGMQPNQNLRRLGLKWYQGWRMPSWGRGDNLASSLPNLVAIELHGCYNLQYLPGMGSLPHLKHLKLCYLSALEFVEDSGNKMGAGVGARHESSVAVEESFFFPSLEELELIWLEKLKGWWKEETEGEVTEVGDVDDTRPPCPYHCFRRLLKLKIEYCPKLTSIPYIPNVQQGVF